MHRTGLHPADRRRRVAPACVVATVLAAVSGVAAVASGPRGAAGTTPAVAVATAAEPPAPTHDRLLRLSPSRPIAPFTLLDQDGRTFRSDLVFPGQVSLVFFGFVHCPDVCPMTLVNLQDVLASAPEFADVRLYMISVDGERDTPAVLKAFLGHVSPRIVGLTGAPARVRPVARSFSASFVRQPPSSPGGSYTVDHSSQVYLVDRAGRLGAILFDAPPVTLQAALRDALR